MTALSDTGRVSETNQNKILILEDDQTQGGAIEQGLKRAGFDVLLASHPDMAMDYIREYGKSISYVIADCLLPKVPGVDFVMALRKKWGGSFKAILLSGIYTDKNFVKDAINQTQAFAFFVKPFDIGKLVSLIQQEEEQREQDRIRRSNLNSRKTLYHIFSSSNLSSRQKRKVIESIEDATGFDIPVLISLLAESKSSGFLNMAFEDGCVTGVTFFEGKIVGVDVPDKATYLGELLIQSGYVDPEDIRVALKEKKKRRMGEYLIQSNLLSPHAFDLALEEQMSIRLGSLVSDQKVKVSFVAGETSESYPNIDPDALGNYLHDWIASKVSVQWLKSFYILWINNVMIRSPMLHESLPIWQSPLMKSLEGLLPKLVAGTTLSALLESGLYNESAVYRGIYLLFVRGLIHFDKKVAFQSEKSRLIFLERLASDFKKRTDFDIIEFFEAAAAAYEAEGAALLIEQVLGECPKDSTSQVYHLWMELRNRIQKAQKITDNTLAKEQAREESEKNEAELKLKAAMLFEDLKQALPFNKFPEAREKAKLIEETGVELPGFPIYNAWSKLGVLAQGPKEKHLKEIEFDLTQVTPEDRFGVHYSYVTALFFKAKGDNRVATKQLRKCLAIDPNFVLAKRELHRIQTQNKKPDLLTMDIKDVVTSLFKKK